MTQLILLHCFTVHCVIVLIKRICHVMYVKMLQILGSVMEVRCTCFWLLIVMYGNLLFAVLAQFSAYVTW